MSISNRMSQLSPALRRPIVATCVTPPCAVGIAVEVAIRSTTGAGPLGGAFILRGTPAQRQDCDGGTGSTCYILGGAGPYLFDVGATGHQTRSQSVTVSGTSPRCGCPHITTQALQVALTPTS